MSDNEIKSINGTKEKVLAGLFWTFGERILAQGVQILLERYAYSEISGTFILI